MHIIYNIDGALRDRGALEPARWQDGVGRRDLSLSLDFVDFARFCAGWKLALSLVSDVVDQDIHRALTAHRLGHLPVFANRRAGAGFAHPFARDGCTSPSRVCRCAIAGMWSEPRWPMTVQVGHAEADLCLAPHADLLFATGRLADVATLGGLPFLPYERLGDVQHVLAQRLQPGTPRG